MIIGLICDLLWSDPDSNIRGWAVNDRGASFTFGEDIVTRFLQKHGLELICRAHQVVEDGYEFFANRKLVTIFSAPNYCGEFDNAGALMSVDENLLCSFQVSRGVPSLLASVIGFLALAQYLFVPIVKLSRGILISFRLARVATHARVHNFARLDSEISWRTIGLTQK